MTDEGDAEEDQQRVLQRPRRPVDDDRGAGDDVAAARAARSRAPGLPPVGAGLARRRVVDRVADQARAPGWRSASLRSGLSRMTIWAEWLFGKR